MKPAIVDFNVVILEFNEAVVEIVLVMVHKQVRSRGYLVSIIFQLYKEIIRYMNNLLESAIATGSSIAL